MRAAGYVFALLWVALIISVAILPGNHMSTRTVMDYGDTIADNRDSAVWENQRLDYGPPTMERWDARLSA